MLTNCLIKYYNINRKTGKMENLNVLLNINSNYIIIGLLVFFFTLEQTISTPFQLKKRSRHLLQNILFQIPFVICNIFFVIFQVHSIDWLNHNNIGLLYLFQLPVWAKLITGVVFYDITTYWIHRSAHKFPLLWRLHRVHHSDIALDSSTFFRSHPIEPIFVFGVGNILTAALFGTDVLSMALYYFILNIFLFSNIQTSFILYGWIKQWGGFL